MIVAMSNQGPAPGSTLRPHTDWLFRLPPFLRNFIVRSYCFLSQLRELRDFFLFDVLALSFVRRGRADAVVIIKNDLVGDYVLIHNFLESVRKSPAYRGKKIIFCANKVLRELVEAFDRDNVDEFIGINRSGGLWGPEGRFALLRRLKRLGAQVALNPTMWRTFMGVDALVRATGAPIRIGLKAPPSVPTWTEKTGWINWNPHFMQKLGDRCYTQLIENPEKLIFEFERNRIFFQAVLGDVPLPERPSLVPVPVPLPELPNRFALILPGASHIPRVWPAENFGQVARHLEQKHGLDIVVTGTAGDAEKAERLAQAAGIPTLDLTGRLSLVQLVALVARAEIIVGNESAGAHLAAALQRPAVIIATDGSLISFHPYPPNISDKVTYIYPPIIRDAPSFEPFLGRTTASIPALAVDVASVIVAVDAALPDT